MPTVEQILKALPAARPFDYLREVHDNLPWNRRTVDAAPEDSWVGDDGAKASGRVLYVLYGSETGNGEELAHTVAAESAKATGLTPRVLDLAHVTPAQLATVSDATFIMSTTGLGDPAVDVEPFVEALGATDAPRLDGLRFGVLALGDQVYADFCAPGKALDARLAELGAERVVDLQTCDIDYEAPATRWLRDAVATFDDLIEAGDAADDADVLLPDAGPRTHGKPYRTAVLESARILTATDPDRQIAHYTLALTEDELRAFEPGDSVEVLRGNDPQLAEQILRHLGIDPDEQVPDPALDDESAGATIRSLLTDQLELRQLPLAFLEEVARRGGDSELASLLSTEDPTALEAWRYGRDLLSVLRAVPDARLDARDLATGLRSLQGRAFSIASSPLVDRSVIDLTVRTIRYEREGRILEGTASGALDRRTDVGADVQVRLRPAPAFHLPEDPSADVIMIGPGVGIAPFRGFLQHREARGDTGRSWLFGGIRDPEKDDLYAEEFVDFHARGVLTEWDVAASRIGRGSQYVQDRIAARAQELFTWLDGGAVLYVCGDAQGMAPAVRSAIRDAAAHELGDAARADVFMADLDAQRRYRQDVY